MTRHLSRPALLVAALSLALAACNTTTRSTSSSARVHAHVGYSPYWRYWGPPSPPIVIPPEPGVPPYPTLPIEPPEPMLPIEPGPDFGGGMGGFDAELF